MKILTFSKNSMKSKWIIVIGWDFNLFLCWFSVINAILQRNALFFISICRGFGFCIDFSMISSSQQKEIWSSLVSNENLLCPISQKLFSSSSSNRTKLLFCRFWHDSTEINHLYDCVDFKCHWLMKRSLNFKMHWLTSGFKQKTSSSH